MPNQVIKGLSGVGAATSVAQEAGAPRVEAEHVRRVVRSLLPYEALENQDRIYFAPLAEESVLLEKWDLIALDRTGMVWEVVGGLAQGLLGPSIEEGSGIDFSPDATALLPRFVELLNG